MTAQTGHDASQQNLEPIDFDMNPELLPLANPQQLADPVQFRKEQGKD